MKELSEELAAHLAGGATTLCHCWRLTRRDGVVLGFTDHDGKLHFEDADFLPQTGFTASQAVQSFGFNAEAGEVAGALSDAAISEADIERGLYDGARVETFRVNWADPAQRVLMRVETVGEIAKGDGHFRVELRGLRDGLNRVRGRFFQRTCDAVVGDGRCKADLDQPQFRADVTVVEVLSERRIRVAGAEGFENGWFSGGLVAWTTGPVAGLSVRVRGHAGDELELEEPIHCETGNEATLTAGCEKTYAACRSKFANHYNFQGFPHMPGDDFALSYPVQGGGNDGSAIY